MGYPRKPRVLKRKNIKRRTGAKAQSKQIAAVTKQVTALTKTQYETVQTTYERTGTLEAGSAAELFSGTDYLTHTTVAFSQINKKYWNIDGHKEVNFSHPGSTQIAGNVNPANTNPKNNSVIDDRFTVSKSAPTPFEITTKYCNFSFCSSTIPIMERRT